MPPKRKKLPDDFTDILESGDLNAMKAVYDTCNLEATTGYRKSTALALDKTPEELIRWLIDSGLDINTENGYGETALAELASDGNTAQMRILLGCGADVHSGQKPPLWSAASRHRPDAIRLLVESGADVNRRDSVWKRTPLTEAVATADPMRFSKVLATIQALLDAGAEVDDETRKFCTLLGKRMNRAPSRVRSKYSDAIAKLNELFDVAPVSRIEPHDGTSPIDVPDDLAPSAQFTFLWDYLVPPGGAAETLQGEIIRIAGRLGREVLGNGYLNWDEDFEAMASFWLGTVDAAHNAVAKVVGKRGEEKEIDEITQASVVWVKAHAEPIALGEVLPEIPYRR